MNDDEKNNNYNSFGGGERKPPDKVIDVTKPRPPQTPMASIDTTRVSAYTLREQQALEKLKKQVGNLDQRENRMSNIKTIVAFILVAILIILAVVFVIIIGKNTASQEQNYDIRISMLIENKSSLSIVTDTGKEQLREIHPGDRIPLSAYVRNSSDYRGDTYDSDSTTPPNIYVRFKLLLMLDYQERYDILIPTISSLWYRYDAQAEATIPGGVTTDDHYFYFKGSISFQQRTELFSELKFDGNTITCDDGGKYGQIQVIVESMEANINSILTDNMWPTAPKRWVIDMGTIYNN